MRTEPEEFLFWERLDRKQAARRAVHIPSPLFVVLWIVLMIGMVVSAVWRLIHRDLNGATNLLIALLMGRVFNAMWSRSRFPHGADRGFLIGPKGFGEVLKEGDRVVPLTGWTDWEDFALLTEEEGSSVVVRRDWKRVAIPVELLPAFRRFAEEGDVSHPLGDGTLYEGKR